MNDLDLLKEAFTEKDLLEILKLILEEFRRCEKSGETFFVSFYAFKGAQPFGSGICLCDHDKTADVELLKAVSEARFNEMLDIREHKNDTQKEDKYSFKRIKIEKKNDGSCEIQLG